GRVDHWRRVRWPLFPRSIMPYFAARLLIAGIVLIVPAMVQGQTSSNPSNPAADKTQGVGPAGTGKVVPITPPLPSPEKNESGSSKGTAQTGDVPNDKAKSPKISGAANGESSSTSIQPDDAVNSSPTFTQPPVPTTTILPGAAANEKDP